ncbi:TPA: hypothetical protein ACPWFU_000252 [Pseudomonas aeruginosa]|uniref:hypothetical protein n=1 Tax=Pseudomonas aeruginosa TaxID=287 RepID=UPI003792C965
MTDYTAKPLSQSDIAIQIERLVNAVIRHDCPAFRISYDAQGDEVVERTRLSRYFDHVRQMYHLVHDETYALSEHLLAFKEACYDIGIEFGMFGMTCMDESEGGLLSEAQTYNWLVERIREHIQTKWFKRGKHDRTFREKGNRQTVTEYVERVLDSRSRTVVVRVDLYYREAARARLTVEDVFEDMDRLIRAREHDPIFLHETGYICAVEQGEDWAITSTQRSSSMVGRCAVTMPRLRPSVGCGGRSPKAGGTSTAATMTRRGTRGGVG